MNEQNEIQGDAREDVQAELLGEREEAWEDAPVLDPMDETELEDWYQNYVKETYGA